MKCLLFLFHRALLNKPQIKEKQIDQNLKNLQNESNLVSVVFYNFEIACTKIWTTLTFYEFFKKKSKLFKEVIKFFKQILMIIRQDQGMLPKFISFKSYKAE